MIDTGMGKIELKPGDVIASRGFGLWNYECVMESKGVSMPWLESGKSKNKKKKRCHQCKKCKSVKLRKCSGCQNVRYCSRKCQKISWNSEHRHDCKCNSI